MHLPSRSRDLRSLVDRGRRSGLKTSELYQALSSRLPVAGDGQGQVDANGFIRVLGPQTQTFKPGEARQI